MDDEEQERLKRAREEPDEERDVFVQYWEQTDPISRRHRETWSVWIGGQQLATYDSEAAAVQSALAYAAEQKLRAWSYVVAGQPPKRLA